MAGYRFLNSRATPLPIIPTVFTVLTRACMFDFSKSPSSTRTLLIESKSPCELLRRAGLQTPSTRYASHECQRSNLRYTLMVPGLAPILLHSGHVFLSYWPVVLIGPVLGKDQLRV